MSMSNGDYPSDDMSHFTESNWDYSHVKSWDCIILDKMVRANPAHQDIPSYITWMTRRTAVSQVRIDIDGTYSGLSIKLIGLESEFPNSTNGWLDCGSLYDGYGTPALGKNSKGCAVGIPALGKSGVYTFTFGPQSSTYSPNNGILLRFKLLNLDILKSLTIKGMIDNPEIVW